MSLQNEVHILIVDDEKTIRMVLADAFTVQGYQVHMANNVQEALEELSRVNIDLALIDLRMPGEMDGLDLLAKIREEWPQIVVIMLTAYATMDSAITALRQGAYDYLIKPTSITQILASVEKGLAKREKELRMQRLITELESTVTDLKREAGLTFGETSDGDRFIQAPQLTIDRQKRLVVRGDTPLSLTSTEFDLLDYLAHHPDRVVSSGELIQAVQGYELDEADARPIVRVHIRRLRQKLEEDPQHPRYILNVRGKGYRFVG
jgi:DNA-binding response OmpR family regulator